MTEARIEAIAKTFGPGFWWILHVDAYDAKTPGDIAYFLRRIRPRLESIPCKMCREHALQYIDRDPPERYVTQIDGLFDWSWRFHNYVNQSKKIPIPTITLAEAQALYGTRSKCETCLNTHTEEFNFRSIPSYPVNGKQLVLIQSASRK